MAGLLIAVFLGWFGGYRFYKKQTALGVLYLFTFGLFGIGWIIDIITALRIYLSSRPAGTMTIDCEIKGAWAESRKNPNIKRKVFIEQLHVGSPLTFETAYYEGSPFYLVIEPSGMDIGALPSEVSKMLLHDYPQAHLSAVLTKVDDQAPTLRLTVQK